MCSPDPKKDTFEIAAYRLRQIKYDLTYVGAWTEQQCGLYFQKPGQTTMRRAKDMGIEIAETERLGWFRFKRVA